jgi:hypothetical protein
MPMVTVQRACEYCGEPFTPSRSDARYCSSSHRAMASKRNRNPQPATAVVADRRRPAVSVSRAETALTWEPVTAPRRAYVTAEPCPDCGTMLLAEPQGTWRACPQCKHPVIPAAVLAPYTGGQQGSERRVVSQRERDLAAIALERRRGLMLAQLAALAADSRLHPESASVVDWLASEVRAAKSETRLDELAGLAADPAAGIRRRHWWHRGLPAIETAYVDDDDDLDDDYDDDGEPPAALPAVAPAVVRAAPQDMTAAAALDILGFRLSAVAGGCQIIDQDELCGAETRFMVASRTGHAWICTAHNEAICRLITRRERELHTTRRSG